MPAVAEHLSKSFHFYHSCGMATLQRVLFSSVIIGIVAFFYEVQGAPTETALRILDSSLSANTTEVSAEEQNRVKRQGGGGCGCGCGCCGCGGGGGGCGCCCCRPRCCCKCTTCRTCCCTRCCTCCRPCCGCGCGCCGCGGGGRKRRSLDNLRILLGAKNSAELKGKELSTAELPRQKRDIMCHDECVPSIGGGFDHDHEFTGIT
ncbi:hypothetical protein COOONC_00464, partial [Cooperia oncophora]